MKKHTQSHVYIIKIAGACNLNCSYCYVYNLGDESYKTRPKVMSRTTAEQTIQRIEDYADETGIDVIQIVLHGGEPLLVKKEWMKWFLELMISKLGSKGRKVEIGLQTNGVLIDREWIELLSQYNVGVGISVDGTKESHDKYRVDHAGRGTFDKVMEAMELMHKYYPQKWGILLVADPSHDPVEIFNFFLSAGIKKMDFLIPDYHYDNPPPFKQEELLSYYVRLFNHWYEMDDAEVDLRIFESIIQALMGKSTGIDSLGPKPLSEITIETDGSIEPLDVMRICENGFTTLGYNVSKDSISKFRESQLFQDCLNNQDLLPDTCKNCQAYQVCGGGYMPHRWKSGSFSNASIHCHTLFNLIHHIYDTIQADLEAVPETVAQ